jgi:hypothetical protein
VPCVRAQVTAASKVFDWGYATASIRPERTSAEMIGASPWYRNPPAWMEGGTKSWPSVYIGSSGVKPAVSPKSSSKRPAVIVGQDVGSTANKADALVRHEREADASEVGAAAAAPDHNVGTLLASEGQLGLGLLADNRLVKQHVVEHRPQRIVRIRTATCVTDRVADRCTQRAGVLGVVYRAGHDVAAPGLHQHPPVGFFLVRRPHHVNLALEAEEGRSEAQGTPPLACTRLGGKTGRPFGFVVEGLRDRCVGLVGPSRGDRLVLVVDAGGSAERFSRRSARTKGVGRHRPRTSRTSPGMST